MPSYRKLKSGNWQATICLPDGGRMSRTWPRRHLARHWAIETQQAIMDGSWTDPREVAITHTPDGLDIHIPATILTMDMAEELEMTVLAIAERHKGA